MLIFEIINIPDLLPPENGLDMLVFIWESYRKEHPVLNRHLYEWVCDYCLIHKLDGRYIPLSRYEFDTLLLLCRNKGKCVEREQILKMLNSTDGNISDVYISHLRNKLELPFCLKIIYTVRSKGYMTDYTMSEYLP